MVPLPTTMSLVPAPMLCPILLLPLPSSASPVLPPLPASPRWQPAADGRSCQPLPPWPHLGNQNHTPFPHTFVCLEEGMADFSLGRQIPSTPPLTPSFPPPQLPPFLPAFLLDAAASPVGQEGSTLLPGSALSPIIPS